MLTVVFRAMKVDEGVDQTQADDYTADEGDEGVEPELDPRWPSRTAEAAAALRRSSHPRFTHTSVTTMPTFS